MCVCVCACARARVCATAYKYLDRQKEIKNQNILQKELNWILLQST